MKKFISVRDVSDINALTDKALAYKANPFKDRELGAGKRIGLLFLNPSMRTRLSTQVAAQNLGMESIVFNIDKEGWALEFEDEAIMSGTTKWETTPATGPGGRGIGVVDMARAIRGDRPHRATGRLGLHVLDAMLATAESIDNHCFVPVESRVSPITPLPEGWDPTERTL